MSERESIPAEAATVHRNVFRDKGKWYFWYDESGAFIPADFRAIVPGRQALVYCDPPYKGMTNYKQGAFDHAAFWETVREWSRRGSTVVVSEYTAPPDFACIAALDRRQELRSAKGIGRKSVTERLFVWDGTEST